MLAPRQEKIGLIQPERRNLEQDFVSPRSGDQHRHMNEVRTVTEAIENQGSIIFYDSSPDQIRRS
jgi:hypothetical protein